MKDGRIGILQQMQSTALKFVLNSLKSFAKILI